MNVPELLDSVSTQSPESIIKSPPRKVLKKEQKQFQCPDCEKSFTQQAHLQIHQRKHSGERPYVCGFQGCSKTFTQLGNLKTHERRHTGIKPFPCDSCEKSFTQLGNLKSHQLKVHSKNKFSYSDNLLPIRKRKIGLKEQEILANMKKVIQKTV
ncbi:hypothetical protein HDV04_001968 [Boothiomyces sp. JEL0838]|nr:hypothetical protein HDV04_001968 [Boothiomyces sp. JEL0838]